jgi:hypothetical protein
MRGETRRRHTNTAQLRAAMPSGRTPTIDSAHEPSMASFDTDDEAAGRPAQRAAIQQALAHEGRASVQAPAGVSKGVSGAVWVFIAITAAAALAWVLLS